MAEDVGKMLDLLNNPEVSSLYHSSIRDMQPADLLRRLESEGVSTRGHMSELRARLLRAEARKLQARSSVPWYPEDEVSRESANAEIESSASENKVISVVVKFAPEQVTETAKPSVEQPATTASVAIIAPDEFMKTMVQLGFWNPDGKPVEPRETASSGGKARNARSRMRKYPFSGRPLYAGFLSDVDKTLRELKLMRREAWQHGMEDYERKIKLLASELKKKLQMGPKNSEIPKQNQDTSKLSVNHHSSVTEGCAAPLSQQQEAIPSTSYDKEVTYQQKAPSRPYEYTQFRSSFANEDLDDDPFEHVDSSDWMDDFIE